MKSPQEIESKIRELVPSLKELSFGCEIFNEQALENQDGVEMDFYGVVIDTDGDGVLVKYYTPKGSQEVTQWLEKDEITEIIGHPIHLENLLQAIVAIDKNKEEKYGKNRALLDDDTWGLTIGNYTLGEIIELYDLTKSFHENITENEALRELLTKVLFEDK